MSKTSKPMYPTQLRANQLCLLFSVISTSMIFKIRNKTDSVIHTVAVVHVRLKDVAIAFSKPIRRPNIFDDEEDTEVPVTVLYV